MTNTPLLSEQHKSMFEFLCQAPRRPGSKHANDVSNWLQEKLRATGLETWCHDTTFKGWNAPESSTLNVVTPEVLKIECFPVMWSASTNGTVSGVLKKSGVELTYEQYPWDQYTLFNEQGEKVLNLLSQPRIYSWVQTFDSEDDPRASIPTVTVDAHSLLERWLAAGEKVTIEANIQTTYNAGTLLSSIIGETSRQPTIGISCHRDSVYNGVGAHDNASGVIALLETADAQMQLPPNTSFFAFDGEELNKIGAYRLASFMSKKNALENLKLLINFDSVAIGERLYVLASENIFERVSELLAGIDIEVFKRESFKQFDTWPFMKLGFSVIQIGSTSKLNPFQYFNSPKDTVGDNGYHLESKLINEAKDIAIMLANEFAET